jgi:hypothetical protein
MNLSTRNRMLNGILRDTPEVTRQVIEQAIGVLAEFGQPFSADDVRALRVDVPGSLVGAAFNAARNRGVIRAVGWKASAHTPNHGKPVSCWVGVPKATSGSAA